MASYSDRMVSTEAIDDTFGQRHIWESLSDSFRSNFDLFTIIRLQCEIFSKDNAAKRILTIHRICSLGGKILWQQSVKK